MYSRRKRERVAKTNLEQSTANGGAGGGCAIIVALIAIVTVAGGAGLEPGDPLPVLTALLVLALLGFLTVLAASWLPYHPRPAAIALLGLGVFQILTVVGAFGGIIALFAGLQSLRSPAQPESPGPYRWKEASANLPKWVGGVIILSVIGILLAFGYAYLMGARTGAVFTPKK